MKQFVKALDSDGEYFQHMVSAFPKLSFDKTKAGVFDGAQIRTLVRDEEFFNNINEKENAAWLSFVPLTEPFLITRRQLITTFWSLQCC